MKAAGSESSSTAATSSCWTKVKLNLESTSNSRVVTCSRVSGADGPAEKVWRVLSFLSVFDSQLAPQPHPRFIPRPSFRLILSRSILLNNLSRVPNGTRSHYMRSIYIFENTKVTDEDAFWFILHGHRCIGRSSYLQVHQVSCSSP